MLIGRISGADPALPARLRQRHPLRRPCGRPGRGPLRSLAALLGRTLTGSRGRVVTALLSAVVISAPAVGLLLRG
ncbi:hypothetical protein [Streptomyces lydicus]|uniref:hypothetical protein n=1 Tax=Streptomyces lydicus TaxID=47763 RepID=UPI00240DE1E0|nr:hypothetical protein [Streptomyces lydicus]